LVLAEQEQLTKIRDMKNLQISYCISLILALTSNHSIQAQYNGGEGDGAFKTSTIQITLNGSQINPLILYRGGDGDGHHKDLINTTMAGAEIADMYNGGFGDGHYKLDFQGTLGGDALSFLYSGGIGDGHYKLNFSGVLDGAEIAQLYRGGEGDGHGKLDFSGLLDGSELAWLYSGGTGDGHDKLEISTLLNGELLDQLYAGGISDGHDKDLFVGVLDGGMLSGLYSGGSGDGFSKHMIQYIFDFPGCTFVVNTDDSGFGSLRYAIDCAAPGDTIDFSPLLIQDSIVLTSGKIDIVKDLYINGIKTALLTVDASLASRAFKTGSNTITIKGLKIIVGTDPIGGAVLNGGIMTLMDVDIYDPTNSSTTVIETTLSGSLRIKGTVTVQEN